MTLVLSIVAGYIKSALQNSLPVKWYQAVCQSARFPVSLSVLQSACINAVPTGRIYVKLGIGNLYETLWGNSKFH